MAILPQQVFMASSMQEISITAVPGRSISTVPASAHSLRRKININNAGTITVGALVYISNLIMNEGAGLFNNNTGGILQRRR